MAQPHDDPLGEILAAFRQMPVPDRPDDGPLLDRLVTKRSPSKRFPTLRRMLMKPAVRYSSVAAFMVVAGWMALHPTPSPALDEVIRATEAHRLVTFRATQATADRETGQTGVGERTVTIDIAEPRVREDEFHPARDGSLGLVYSAVYDHTLDRALFLTSYPPVEAGPGPRPALLPPDASKNQPIRATLMRIASTRTDDLPPMSLIGRRRGFFDTLRELQSRKETVISQEKLDGREVTRYHLRDGKITTAFWVDPATKLPIRAEIEILDPVPRIARNHWIYDDFRWDPRDASPQALFSTDPPAGYPLDDQIKAR